jgi:hypothetical protein
MIQCMRRLGTFACIAGALLTLAVIGGCGDDDANEDEPCTLGTAEGCEGSQLCEEVMGGEPECFAPLVLRGRVFDQSDDGGVADATIVALDINGGARSSVVRSDDDGTYAVTLPALRQADGTPIAEPVTLQVAAAGYQPFPQAPRQALPIDLDAAIEADDERTVDNAATDVGLIALPGDRSSDGTIAGSIEADVGAIDAGAGDPHAATRGALVVAVQGDSAVSVAISDLEGAFTLFNVPAGDTRVEAYRAGLVVEPESVSVEAGEVTGDVLLTASGEGLASVSGSVNIVNAEGGLQTSVVLALASTFDADVVRGIAPAGLRAADVASAFTIDDVPPGEYAVLAAFENDELVRDPDESIAGTDVVFITVGSDGAPVDLPESFKITQALDVVSPGADEPEVLDAGGDPTFVWADDSSEDGYEVRVYDAFGELVHEALDVARVTGSETVSYTWSGATLEQGMIYQFRVVSFREQRQGGGRTYISGSEDLRGVFQAGMIESGNGDGS